MAKFPNVVGVRLTDDDVAKLDRLARRTFRQRGDVLRCLIDRADALAEPDLILGKGTQAKEPSDVSA